MVAFECNHDVMVRTQIQLEKSQVQRLKALASQQSKSISQLVRESVAKLLTEAEAEERWQELRDVVGSCHEADGSSDVSVRHDAHLQAVYRR